MRTIKKILFSALILFFLLPLMLGVQFQAPTAAFSDTNRVKENSATTQAIGVPSSESIGQTLAVPVQESLPSIIEGGHQAPQFSPAFNTSFTRHLMCRDYDPNYSPIEPTTIFRPSDTKATCLATVSMNSDDTVDFRWYYRNYSFNAWVSCYNWSYHALNYGEQFIEAHLNIRGSWPELYYPRAYKVEAYYLNSSFLFSDFFEVTNGGLNSPRTCEGVDSNEQPVKMKSRFTIGVDIKAYHYLRFDKMAYFNEESGYSHNFTTVWIQPNGSTYNTHSGSFTDYKNENVSWNYWEYGVVSDDYISIDQNTPIGNWKVEVYLDSYFNNTWVSYGPIATTPFIVGSEPVKDWTFMAYLDADNTLERAGIDIFKDMTSVGSSPNVSIVAQMDRNPGYNATLGFDDRYGNWTECYRFNVTKDMDPTPDNATPPYLGEVNMGDPATLKDFVNWTMSNYPANHYCLVLFDHGAGFIGICSDMTDNDDSLSLPELSQALSGLPAIIDVVLADACSMNMMEVAYQIKDCANILVGPEGLGYAPAPYNTYLSDLIGNFSMAPSEFTKRLVTDYIDWSLSISTSVIPNATMSAIDLTKITSLAAAIEDFATNLKEKETPYHNQINLARNAAEGYPGPYEGYTGCYMDLYHFAQLTYQSILDEKLRNSADHLINALSTGNAIIIQGYKNLPNSHGLSIFFPDEKGKYDSFKSMYEDTNFTIDTSWDEFLKYHLSGIVLRIQTYPSHADIPIGVNDTSYTTYTTDAEGKIQVFVLPNFYYTINFAPLFFTGPDSRLVFARWNDSHTENPVTLFVNIETTLKAEYQTQYRLVMNTNLGTTNPSGGEHWYDNDSSIPISASAPSLVYPSDQERYDCIWFGTGNGSYGGTNSSSNVILYGPINETVVWTHEYYLIVNSSHGSPTPVSRWFEAGTSINASVTSPDPVLTGTRYVCTGWIGTGSSPASGTSTATNFTIDKPSKIEWSWKTQYQLTVNIDPFGLNPEPSISPPESWHDAGATVNCTAQKISGYVFDHWTSGSASWDLGVNPITITMNQQMEITAHYVHERAWWQTVFSPDVMQVILGLLGTVVTVALVGVAWVRTRKGRGVIKAFLDEIDDVYSKLKTDPEKCEQELYRLRNTILEGVTDGRITEESYDILDKRIDKYMEELKKQRQKDANE